MNIKIFLIIGFLFASVFFLSCTPIDNGDPYQSNQYCYIVGQGCALIGADDRCYVYSTTDCLDTYKGTIKTYGWCNTNFGPSKIFDCDNRNYQDGYCWYYGSCYNGYTPSECYYIGGTFYPNGCPSEPPEDEGYCLLNGECWGHIPQSQCISAGGTFDKYSCSYLPPPPPSSGQYCYVPEEYACALIGTSSRCFVSSATECQYQYGGSTKTLEWCNANVGYWSTYGCEAGYCLYDGECIDKVMQSECISAGGTFYENQCPAPPPPSGDQYCYNSYYDDCDLIGSDYSCFYNSVADCQYQGGSVQTLEWCYSRVGYMNTNGCIYWDWY